MKKVVILGAGGNSKVVVDVIKKGNGQNKEDKLMAFFNSAVDVLQTLVVALGAGLGIWGAINLLEGYGNDNPGANAHVP